ncbi:MAG: hypothetical protein Q8R38_00755 [Candidatus Omnitrophota bacterium]|nr:hypothetical protein [Candidatus Omnitrophota bacterium]
MRNKIAFKIICVVVAALFLFNDICFGLGTQPGSTQPATKSDMYAAGQKLFAEKVGPGSIDWDRANPATFAGYLPNVPSIHFVKADYNNPPKGWENNPMMQKTDLIEAFKYFRDNEAKIPAEYLDIREGCFPVNEKAGELPISRIEATQEAGRIKYVLIIHTKFVQMWNHIRENDVWYRDDEFGPANRTMSVAWGIFYRLAKHEMGDLKKADLSRKGGGHISFGSNGDDYFKRVLDVARNEDIANSIKGAYWFHNDAIWMWFLASYCFNNNTRYNNSSLRERMKYILGSYGSRLSGGIFSDYTPGRYLGDEFPYFEFERRYLPSDKEHFYDLAALINYHFFGTMPDFRVPEFHIAPKFIREYNEREALRKSAGIVERPMYATGTSYEDEFKFAASLTGDVKTYAKMDFAALRKYAESVGVKVGSADKDQIISLLVVHKYRLIPGMKVIVRNAQGAEKIATYNGIDLKLRKRISISPINKPDLKATLEGVVAYRVLIFKLVTNLSKDPDLQAGVRILVKAKGKNPVEVIYEGMSSGKEPLFSLPNNPSKKGPIPTLHEYVIIGKVVEAKPDSQPQAENLQASPTAESVSAPKTENPMELVKNAPVDTTDYYVRLKLQQMKIITDFLRLHVQWNRKEIRSLLAEVILFNGNEGTRAKLEKKVYETLGKGAAVTDFLKLHLSAAQVKSPTVQWLSQSTVTTPKTAKKPIIIEAQVLQEMKITKQDISGAVRSKKGYIAVATKRGIFVLNSQGAIIRKLINAGWGWRFSEEGDSIVAISSPSGIVALFNLDDPVSKPILSENQAMPASPSIIKFVGLDIYMINGGGKQYKFSKKGPNLASTKLMSISGEELKRQIKEYEAARAEELCPVEISVAATPNITGAVTHPVGKYGNVPDGGESIDVVQNRAMTMSAVELVDYVMESSIGDAQAVQIVDKLVSKNEIVKLAEFFTILETTLFDGGKAKNIALTTEFVNGINNNLRQLGDNNFVLKFVVEMIRARLKYQWWVPSDAIKVITFSKTVQEKIARQGQFHLIDYCLAYREVRKSHPEFLLKRLSGKKLKVAAFIDLYEGHDSLVTAGLLEPIFIESLDPKPGEEYIFSLSLAGKYAIGILRTAAGEPDAVAKVRLATGQPVHNKTRGVYGSLLTIKDRAMIMSTAGLVDCVMKSNIGNLLLESIIVKLFDERMIGKLAEFLVGLKAAVDKSADTNKKPILAIAETMVDGIRESPAVSIGLISQLDSEISRLSGEVPRILPSALLQAPEYPNGPRFVRVVKFSLDNAGRELFQKYEYRIFRDGRVKLTGLNWQGRAIALEELQENRIPPEVAEIRDIIRKEPARRWLLVEPQKGVRVVVLSIDKAYLLANPEGRGDINITNTLDPMTDSRLVPFVNQIKKHLTLSAKATRLVNQKRLIDIIASYLIKQKIDLTAPHYDDNSPAAIITEVGHRMCNYVDKVIEWRILGDGTLPSEEDLGKMPLHSDKEDRAVNIHPALDSSIRIETINIVGQAADIPDSAIANRPKESTVDLEKLAEELPVLRYDAISRAYGKDFGTHQELFANQVIEEVRKRQQSVAETKTADTVLPPNPYGPGRPRSMTPLPEGQPEPVAAPEVEPEAQATQAFSSTRTHNKLQTKAIQIYQHVKTIAATNPLTAESPLIELAKYESRLTHRIERIVRTLKVNSIGELQKKTLSELFGKWNIGEKNLVKIQLTLIANGLKPLKTGYPRDSRCKQILNRVNRAVLIQVASAPEMVKPETLEAVLATNYYCLLSPAEVVIINSKAEHYGGNAGVRNLMAGARLGNVTAQELAAALKIDVGLADALITQLKTPLMMAAPEAKQTAFTIPSDPFRVVPVGNHRIVLDDSGDNIAVIDNTGQPVRGLEKLDASTGFAQISDALIVVRDSKYSLTVYNVTTGKAVPGMESLDARKGFGVISATLIWVKNSDDHLTVYNVITGKAVPGMESLHVYGDPQRISDMFGRPVSGSPASVGTSGSFRRIGHVHHMRPYANDGGEVPAVAHEIISEYIVWLGLDKDPASEALPVSESERLYKTVNLLHESKIELFVPQGLRLTEDMKKALKDVGKRGHKSNVECREYSNENHLAQMLKEPVEAGTGRMTLIEDAQKNKMQWVAQTFSEAFKTSRMLTISLPNNYGNMDSKEKTVFQAKFIMIAILGRLFEKGKTPMVEALLSDMLKGCLDLDEPARAAFINELGLSDDEVAILSPEDFIRRISRLLGTPLKLVERIGQEIRLMKNFWIAA